MTASPPLADKLSTLVYSSPWWIVTYPILNTLGYRAPNIHYIYLSICQHGLMSLYLYCKVM